MSAEVNGNRIILFKTRLHRMVNSAKAHGLIMIIQSAIIFFQGSLSVTARIHVVNGQTIDGRGIILAHGKTIVHIIEGTAVRPAHT